MELETRQRQNEVGVIAGLSVSTRRGIKKTPVPKVMLLLDRGIEGDAHAGDWHRQVSLLAEESIAKMRARGLTVGPGDFAENITTRGIDLPTLVIGDRLLFGDVQLEVTQVGKECHTRCAIYAAAGDCVMPREGIFARVLHGGELTVGDTVRVARRPGPTS